MGLEGKTAVVTGGGRGLGFAFATRLKADGANVVLADLEGAEAAARKIEGAIGVTADVSKEADVARLADAAVKAFGRIDILVNNAAIFANMTHGPFEALPIDEWHRMMAVNVFGTFLCARAMVPHMRKQGGGRIINLSSGTALKGVPGSLHYVTSKAAVIGFTRSLARELGKDRITVNAIAPGLTRTEGALSLGEGRLEIQRLTRAIQRDEEPQDLVGAVSFLASDEASFITGQTLAVDGGSAML